MTKSHRAWCAWRLLGAMTLMLGSMSGRMFEKGLKALKRVVETA